MSEYEIVDANAEDVGGCGFCGRKDPNNEGYRRKSGAEGSALILVFSGSAASIFRSPLVPAKR